MVFLSDTTIFIDEAMTSLRGVSLVAEVQIVESPYETSGPVQVADTPFTMGRGSDCSMPVLDDQASRYHCQIEREGAVFYLKDLNSTNGTFLNGVRVVSSRLHAGDQIQVGSSQILFSVGYRFGG